MLSKGWKCGELLQYELAAANYRSLINPINRGSCEKSIIALQTCTTDFNGTTHGRRAKRDFDLVDFLSPPSLAFPPSKLTSRFNSVGSKRATIRTIPLDDSPRIDRTVHHLYTVKRKPRIYPNIDLIDRVNENRRYRLASQLARLLETLEARIRRGTS